MAAPPPANPYPGLRAFEPDEHELFFGRERETDELRRRLRTTRLLAVIGSSGSGKSSLVRSGLIPSLHGGFMAGAGTSWRVAITRPGEDPIGRLADALDRPEVLGVAGAQADMRHTLLEVTLRDSSLGVAEAVRHAGLPAGDNVLLLVDQFEELFRFRRSRPSQAGDDAAAFVKLLLEAARCPELPIYVVLTMRSEFIGECIAFEGLPEAVNAGQYLIPRMPRDALRAAITGPAAVRGATIAPRLLARLLNEVGDDLDRLPVLQHALMRTWDAWSRDHAPGEPVDVCHYEVMGTMEEALSRHAGEAYAELDGQRERAIAERLFKALTETSEDGRGVRRPTAVQRLVEVCGASAAELERVIDRFRAPGRAFLQPPAGMPLAPQDIVDISHESLMRLWTRLASWVREEARAIDVYRRLARSAAQHAAGEASLWRPPELTIGLRWARETRPSAAWAGGEGAAFEQAMRFLRRSHQVYRLKVGLAAAGTATAVALAIAWFAGQAREQRAQAEHQRQENVKLQAEVTRLQAATAASAQARQAQSEQVQALRDRNAELKSRVATLQQARSDIEARVATLREANRALEAELGRLAAEKTRLRERSNALDAAFARLTQEAEDLAVRTRQLGRVAPMLQAQLAALRAQVDALRERNRMLARLVRETQPCEEVQSVGLPGPAPTMSIEETLARAAPVAPLAAIPPDPASSDALRRLIDELSRQLAALLEERARLRDEAAWLEKENALLDRQREALQRENARLEQERAALEVRQRALREAAARAETERQALAARVEASQARNERKLAEVEAARQAHQDLERRAVAEADAIGAASRDADRLRADNQRLTGIMTRHAERLLRGARSAEQPSDLAALLAVKAWRWAPYDTDDAAQPAVYNTLWQVLSRIDDATARRLIAPGDPAAGKLATTRSAVLAQALCQSVTRPLTEAEWRRFMPEAACFRPEAAQPCAR
ncbi:MAG TPA: hypothetical protein VLT62_16305 [Candidatus Methylomirabilis sp.]|nr:hypothetical protein [Candidatus Methylomirabilis sp.]